MNKSEYGNDKHVDGWQIDHIIPSSKNGSDNLSNLQAMQWENNQSKSDGPDNPNEYCVISAIGSDNKKNKSKERDVKMKKILIILLMSLVFANIGAVSASEKIKDEVVLFFDEISKIQDEWKSAKIKDQTKIFDEFNEYYGSIYRVYTKNNQQGYIVYIEGYGVVQATFEGTDPVINIKGKVYLVYPGVFMSKNNFDEYKYTDDFIDRTAVSGYGNGYAWYYKILFGTAFYNQDFNYNISTSTVPDLDINYDLTTYSFGVKGLIDDMPDYVNDLIPNGCGAFSAAMMIAYYDNEFDNGLSSLDGSGSFPLTYEDDSSDMVRDLALDLALWLDTCNANFTVCDGTTADELAIGMESYFISNSFAEYEFYISPINDVDVNGDPITNTVNEWSDYIELIKTGNPAIILIGAGEYDEAHMALGVGYISTPSETSTGFLIHDNIDSGVTWISRDFVHYFGFIYEQ